MALCQKVHATELVLSLLFSHLYTSALLRCRLQKSTLIRRKYSNDGAVQIQICGVKNC